VTPTVVAFVPSAPLLVPQVAGGSAALDNDLRLACLEAVSRALDSEPEDVVVVGAAPTAGHWDGGHTWDFAGFGVPRVPADERPPLPWPLGIGAWLLDECGWSGERRYVGVDTDAEPALDVSDRSMVVAVADGSACRTERAPGHLDPRAEGFDDATADLLTRGDASALAEIDPTLARDLLCGGVPVWRLVAASVGASPVARAELLTHVAPYGVGYFVALWWF
jgi:hypothetical protein